MDGAVDGLSAWERQGHKIDIVTGRPTSARDVTLEWLDTHNVPYDRFVMVDKYNRPGNDLSIAVSKNDLVRMPYDLAVEDSSDMAMLLARDMGVATALIDRPWNWNCPAHGNVTRCLSWAQIAPMADAPAAMENPLKIPLMK